MLSKVFPFALLLSLASCVGQARADGPTATPTSAPPIASQMPPITVTTRATRPVEWRLRDPDAALWPSSTRRLQIIITPGWERGEHFAWLISDGNKVIKLYRASSRDLNGLLAEVFGNLTKAEQQAPTASLSYGGAGTVIKPTTPDPPPAPILPGSYVDSVMKAAWKMDQQVDPDILNPTGP